MPRPIAGACGWCCHHPPRVRVASSVSVGVSLIDLIQQWHQQLQVRVELPPILVHIRTQEGEHQGHHPPIIARGHEVEEEGGDSLELLLAGETLNGLESEDACA